MIWFLRFFHAYRELESRVSQLSAEKRHMDDSFRRLESRLDDTEEKRTKASEEALLSVKINADFIAQTTMGRTIYGIAPELPGPEDQPEVIKSKTVQARDVEAYANSPEGLNELFDEATRMWKNDA